MKLTKATIAALTLPSGKQDHIEFDDLIPGFGVRLREGGSASYVFQFKIGNKQRRLTLGRCSAIDPSAARKQASELHAKVRLGGDPAGTKAESRSRAEETFGECLGVYLNWQRPQVRPSTFRDIERHLVRNLSALHGLHISKVDRRSIAIQLAKIANRAPVQANRTRTSLSAFLNWCGGEGFVEVNHAQFTNVMDENEPRDRHLSDNEIHAFWYALPDRTYGDILKVLLLTGQREHEIADLRWDEIDFERGVIELPPHRVKNHRKHTIPMSDTVQDILKAQPRRQDRALVFGQTGTHGFSGWARAKLRLDRVLKIPPWRVHDLGRTCATGMADLGVQPHVIEAVLNHASGTIKGVAATYNRSGYEPEKRSALTMWADHVAAVIEGRSSKVTALRRGNNK